MHGIGEGVGMTKEPLKSFVKHYCRLCGAWIEGTLCSYDCENDDTDRRPSESVGVAIYELKEAQETGGEHRTLGEGKA